jgi:hypothetical protein
VAEAESPVGIHLRAQYLLDFGDGHTQNTASKTQAQAHIYNANAC